MKRIEDECVGCDLPCLGNSCHYKNVVRFYCDRCGEEGTLYRYNDKELCEYCLLNEFEIVNGSEEYS
jgi:hypothetical protein